MDIATGNWFSYLNENILTEGLRDIGLPEFVVDYLEEAMPNASEKAKVYIGKNWKGSKGQTRGTFMLSNLQYEIVDKLVRDYGEYVIATKETGGDMDPESLEARTVGKWEGGVDGQPVKRAAFDDERIKQGEQVKFVIQNLKNTVGNPMGTWRKAFMKAVKALSKAGLPSEKVEDTKEYLANFYQNNFDYWVTKYSDLIAFLNDDPTNYELVKGEENIDEAEKIANEYLENKEDPENIMHTFDDGSYWYNLDVSSCDVEGARMGHCGSDGRGVLVSLRKKKGKRKESSSYVTMTWSSYENTVYQIKGRSNDAPPEEVWGHIAWFINNLGVENVEETGEHSNDEEGIHEMIEYLSRETNANFHGSLEDRMEKATEYCDGVDNRFYDNRDELENSSISYSLEESDMGAEVYVYMSADYNFDINLGWTGVRDTDEVYRAKDQDFTPIPSTYGTPRREFIADLGIDEMMYEMPGNDGDYEYEIRMLEGVTPGWQVGDPDTEPTAHLSITLRTSDTAAADEDGEVREYDEFADSMLHFEENDAAAAIEEIRQALSAGGYMAKTAYDRNKEGLESLTDLDKWHVKKAQGGLEFDWTAEDGQPLHSYPQPVPQRAHMYGMGTGNQMGNVNPNGIFREIFGYGKSYTYGRTLGMMDVTIARVFAAKLGNLVKNSLRTVSKAQQSFDFGDKYEAIDPVKFLADDTDFVIFQNAKYNAEGNIDRYPLMTISWLYRMRVSPSSEEGEFEVIRDIAEYLNEKPELVTDAANETIKFYLDTFMQKINTRRDRVISNEEIQSLINRTKETYGRAADAASENSSEGEVARKIYTMATWFEGNYNDMSEAERYIAITRFLGPMAANRFRSYSNEGSIDNDTGAPVMFPEMVETQLLRMGAPEKRLRPTQESVEQQIQRIDQLLGEAKQDTRPTTEPTPFKSKAQKRYKRSRKKNSKMYNTAGHKNLKTGAPYTKKGTRAGTDRLRFEEVDVRLYKMQIDAVVSSERASGGSKLLQDELRSIPGVTVVSVEKTRDLAGGADFARFNVKFSLMGQAARLDFVEGQLMPALRKVQGFEVKDWSMPQEVTPGKKLRESAVLHEYGFGGVAGNLGAQRFDRGNQMVTPRPSLQTIVDDWVDGGVMAYDVPTDTTDMRYNVMMPVEELLPYINQMYRGDMRDFTGRYHEFIKNGAAAPVYLAIGMNGRVKITGGEDIVWFAKKSGLAEVPVFFSYQKQV